jgi:S-DNA-T family DNA segregation ATPase FtsK/SpoIIIE
MQPANQTMPAEPADTSLPRGVSLEQGLLWDEEPDKFIHQDPLLEKAVALVREEGKASITMLQRKMRIGYTRAARLIDAMEDLGIISEAQPNSQVREILNYGDSPDSPDAD